MRWERYHHPIATIASRIEEHFRFLEEDTVVGLSPAIEGQ
jgi:hypothetical protein